MSKKERQQKMKVLKMKSLMMILKKTMLRRSKKLTILKIVNFLEEEI